MLNENLVIPDEFQADLLHLRDLHTAIQFRVGDITCRIIEHNAMHQVLIPKMSIYKAVGSFFGKSSRSIRVYAQVAEFFPPEIREAYTVLAFEHFRVACSMGEKWRQVLDWSLDQIDTTGKPATVDAILNEFYYAPGEPQESESDELERNALHEVTGHISGIRAVFEGRREQLPARLLDKLWSSLQVVDRCAQELIAIMQV